MVQIARKCSKRLGRRFIARGLDRDGGCANFVETETIIQVRGEDQEAHKVLSHV